MLIFNDFVESKNNIEIKNWEDYSDSEKDELRKRWTPENIKLVIKALSRNREIHDYFFEISCPEKNSIDSICYDLRCIGLHGKDLAGVDLSNSYLQGAMLTPDYEKKGRHLLFKMNDLSHAIFHNSNLQYAQLDMAILEGASFFGADLSKAHLLHANLQEADLTNAKLEGTYLGEANLEKARLWRANLKKTNLLKANLKDADMLNAIFDSTYLWGTNLSEAKNIRYIRWGDEFEDRYIIGEEAEADSKQSMEDYKKAEILYRDLKHYYEKELMPEIAVEFNYRENEVKTKMSSWYCAIPRTIFFKWTYGYGSRPIWLIWCSLIVISFFGLVFLILAICKKSKSGIEIHKNEKLIHNGFPTFNKGKLIFHCLYFSLLSFTTFGYGTIQPSRWLQFFKMEPTEYKPIRWARVFVGIEAIIGIYILGLLVMVLL